MKLLDLSRAIAAPTIGKFCAALGATVIRVGCESLSELPMTLIDGCTDKISVDINLKTFEGRKKLMELIKEADIFVDGYRPATLEHLGFGRDAVLGLCAQRDKGIVYVQENCYGWNGPWSTRAGWAQIADSVRNPEGKLLWNCTANISSARFLEFPLQLEDSTALMRHRYSLAQTLITC